MPCTPGRVGPQEDDAGVRTYLHVLEGVDLLAAAGRTTSTMGIEAAALRRERWLNIRMIPSCNREYQGHESDDAPYEGDHRDSFASAHPTPTFTHFAKSRRVVRLAQPSGG
jgi:hypothetical protein